MPFSHSAPIQRETPWDDHVPTSLPSLPNPITNPPSRLKICRKGCGANPFRDLTWVHAQERSQQEHKESLHLGITSLGLPLGCLLLGQVIYPGRPGVPTRSSLRRHLRELLAGPREGLLCVLGYLCLVPLLFPCHSPGSPPLLPPPPSLLPLGKVLTGVEKAPNSSEQGRPYAFLQSHWGCSGTLWTRLSTPGATLSGAIVFKSRTKCSLNQQLWVFICLFER